MWIRIEGNMDTYQTWLSRNEESTQVVFDREYYLFHACGTLWDLGPGCRS